MDEAEVLGLEKLTNSERDDLYKILTENYIKMQRVVKNNLKLKLQIKTYKNDGPKKKYSLNLSAITPAKTFKSSAADWNFARTLHKVIKKILEEIEHRFHSSEQK